jgi:heptosyltransferase-1
MLPDRLSPLRILIVKLSSLGDVVNATPCFRALRCYFPHAELTLAVERAYVPLVQSDPHLDRILPAPTWDGTPVKRLWHIWRALADRRFDLALDLQGSPRSAAWVYLSRARQQSGRGNWRPFWTVRVPWDPTQHAVENNIAVLERLGIPVAVRAPALTVRAWAQTSLDCILHARGLPRSGFLLLAPFSRWASKAWPVERVRALLASCKDKGIGPAVLIGGIQDVDKIGSDNAVSLVGHLRLEETMALCTRARLLVTVDTGPMHVAAALGTALVALFGPTWPEHSGPWGQLDAVIQVDRPAHHHAYRTASLDAVSKIDVETVASAIAARWSSAARAA